MSELFSVQNLDSCFFKDHFSDQFYHIFFFEGKGVLSVDLTEYSFDGKNILFTSPYQNIQIKTSENFQLSMLSFH